MAIQISLTLPPEVAANEALLRKEISKRIKTTEGFTYTIDRRSIDARSRMKGPQVLLQLTVHEKGDIIAGTPYHPQLQNVTNAEPILIIGAGPAGLFAALECIKKGKRPIVLERGKDVRARRRDLAILNREGTVNPDSNYCFGEGGAGTYSDGKLYTRSTKRGDVRAILQAFVHYGAPPEILIDAHPHIGTNKLPGIITNMRMAIEASGGLVLFEHRVTEFIIKEKQIAGLKCSNGSTFAARACLLATGHSARDIYEILHQQGILLESKPFALGVRIEHPQALIDSIQYHCVTRSQWLPPAAYSLVAQAEGRGVFSFCMCPGGIIAPAATGAGEVVVNGWSPSKRNNPFANSGTVATVEEKDFAAYGFTGPSAGLHYQAMVEQNAYKAGGGKLVAPAQRMVDFINNKNSSTLPACSYQPGITGVQMKDILPTEVHDALKNGINQFGKKMKGYLTNEAVLVATESRTSSPVRIPRDATTLMHPQVAGLFPCAEGAGYAGGIVSAALDGVRCVESLVGILK